MTNSVDISDFVNATLTITATATPYQNFSVPLIIGDSSVIDTTQRLRTYSNLLGVAADFGTTASEYLAATVFFGQSPTPSQCMIGRWARTATHGLLHGATLTPTQQLLTNFTAITAGSFHISVDGTGHDFTGINLATALNLNGVASLLQTAIQVTFSGATVIWGSVNQRFDIISGTTGASSSVSYGSTAASGTDISTLLGLTSAAGASAPVVGMAAETPLAAWTALAGVSNQWYVASFAASTQPATADYIAIASATLASSRKRMFGVTITTTDCLDPTNTTDLATSLQSLNNNRVYWWYDPLNPYGVMTMFGRAATVNFNASKSTITLAYKQAPGLTAAYLTETQFATLKVKGGNCNVAVNNGAVMIQPGQMADSKWLAGTKINGTWFDEVHNTDWFLNEQQTDVFNALYTTTTKVPQTDGGSNSIATVLGKGCAKAANNGMIGPGVWTGPPIGTLETGDYMPTGWYIYYPPISTQSDADRDSRVSVPFQEAIKLQGAVHQVSLAITVNR